MIHTRETYEWVLGDTRYECVYRKLPPLPKLVCAYVAGRYAYRGNLDEIYLSVAERIPASIFDTPTAAMWQAVLKYCRQFSNIADGEDYVDNTGDLSRDDVLEQMRADYADSVLSRIDNRGPASGTDAESIVSWIDSDTESASDTESILSWLGSDARGTQSAKSADEELSVETVRRAAREFRLPSNAKIQKNKLNENPKKPVKIAQ